MGAIGPCGASNEFCSERHRTTKLLHTAVSLWRRRQGQSRRFSATTFLTFGWHCTVHAGSQISRHHPFVWYDIPQWIWDSLCELMFHLFVYTLPAAFHWDWKRLRWHEWLVTICCRQRKLNASTTLMHLFPLVSSPLPEWGIPGDWLSLFLWQICYSCATPSTVLQTLRSRISTEVKLLYSYQYDRLMFTFYRHATHV